LESKEEEMESHPLHDNIRRSLLLMFFSVVAVCYAAAGVAAEIGGKPEKTDIVVTYAQPSGAFTPK
jgi:hypothetical protein